MGMFTECVVHTKLNDLQQVDIDAIKYMVGEIECPDILPDHELFQTNNWEYMFQSNSYYFIPESVSLFKFSDIGNFWTLITRFDVKSYDGEVDKLFDWLRQFVNPGYFMGTSRYEESKEPTLHYGGFLD